MPQFSHRRAKGAAHSSQNFALGSGLRADLGRKSRGRAAASRSGFERCRDRTTLLSGRPHSAHSLE